jgi:hypothetical protein
VFEIIEACSEAVLSIREHYWWGQLPSGHAYNIHEVLPTHSYRHSADTKSKIGRKSRARLLGVPRGRMSEVTKSKVSASHTGILHTQETKDKLSSIRKQENRALWWHGIKGASHPLNKNVVQKDLSGTVLQVWVSGKAAARALCIDSSGISGCCRGVAKTYKGFLWGFN